MISSNFHDWAKKEIMDAIVSGKKLSFNFKPKYFTILVSKKTFFTEDIEPPKRGIIGKYKAKRLTSLKEFKEKGKMKIDTGMLDFPKKAMKIQGLALLYNGKIICSNNVDEIWDITQRKAFSFHMELNV